MEYLIRVYGEEAWKFDAFENVQKIATISRAEPIGNNRRDPAEGRSRFYESRGCSEEKAS